MYDTMSHKTTAEDATHILGGTIQPARADIALDFVS
jgi:hypothetical protein